MEKKARRLQATNQNQEVESLQTESKISSEDLPAVSSRPKVSKWGFTEGDKVRIKNTVDVSGYRVPQAHKKGYVVNFTSRFVQIKIRFKKDRDFIEKVILREPQNIELITAL